MVLQDKNGTLEGTELSNLVIDILQDHAALTGEEYNAKDVYEVEQALLKVRMNMSWTFANNIRSVTKVAAARRDVT